MVKSSARLERKIVKKATRVVRKAADQEDAERQVSGRRASGRGPATVPSVAESHSEGKIPSAMLPTAALPPSHLQTKRERLMKATFGKASKKARASETSQKATVKAVVASGNTVRKGVKARVAPLPSAARAPAQRQPVADSSTLPPQRSATPDKPRALKAGKEAKKSVREKRRDFLRRRVEQRKSGGVAGVKATTTIYPHRKNSSDPLNLKSNQSLKAHLQRVLEDPVQRRAAEIALHQRIMNLSEFQVDPIDAIEKHLAATMSCLQPQTPDVGRVDVPK